MTNTRTRPDEWCRCEDGRWHPWVAGECTRNGPEERGDVVPVTPFYSAALDEIWRLRRVVAYTASVLEHALDSRLTQKRRDGLRGWVVRLRRCARGDLQAQLLYPDVHRASLDAALAEAGTESGAVTRYRWELETFGQTEAS